MKVVSLNDVEPGSRPRRVAIGTFDGVHRGHREVIRGADTVLTFDPHPLSVIHPEATPKLISTFPVKRDLIAGLGVEELVVIPFDKGFAAQSAEDFVQHVLLDRLGAEQVSVGENFRFGKGARGHARVPPRKRRVRDARGAARRGRRRDDLLEPHPRPGAGRRGGPGGRVPRRAVPVRGRGGAGRQARPRAGHADRQPRAGRRLRDPGPRRLRGLGQRPPRRGERGRAPDLRDRPRPARGGAPDRLRRRHLRRDAAHRLPGAPARREALRARSTSWSRR